MTQAGPNGFQSLRKYLDDVASGTVASLLDTSGKPDHANLKTRYLLDLYQGTSAEHSFMDASGQIFDCIPIDKQPAVIKSGKPVAKPPRLPERTRATDNRRLLLNPADKDHFGNARQCPVGTVPIRRVTLEELGRFKSLEDFLRKAPRSPRASRSLLLTSLAAQHEYAHAYQNVDNIGGRSVLNVWKPRVVTPGIFSLSQQWYIATGTSCLQTVECGWQVYPDKYGHPDPVLFTYWTADGYCKTGSYSTDAKDFVQYGTACPVGLSLKSVSTRDGPQAELELSFLLAEDKWWLFVNGTAEENAVGYYPTSLYDGGPLTKAATEIDYGGETCGDGVFPPMGSAAFANEGIGKAAYQRNISYFQPNQPDQGAMLTASEEWPRSYTIVMGQNDTWGEHFFFGGPGS